ncbi:MAG TPA: DmsE family decaheme c-type cytochrome [Dissulfurispiraceae bacterium]|nr:DmsE family decaheme c-type cytochrome [Dissulfurispiraceae bacterium]
MIRRYLILIFSAFTLLLFSAVLSIGNEIAPLEKKGYIGAETCKGCHEGQFETYKHTVHSKKHVKGPESQDACETCHGPGAKHVEKGGGRGVDIFTFTKKGDPEMRTAKCLACHEVMRDQAFWNNSKHKNEGVACDDCHSPHRGGNKLLKADKSEVCYQCHRDIRAMVNKQSHHPIKEGKISCNDCHNPHGEVYDKMLRSSSVNDLCYKCHAEKRGPYLNQHPPVEENCDNCHNPHGSNHNRLLSQRVPVLCEQCHGNGGNMGGAPFTHFGTSAPGIASANQKVYMYGRACLNCHPSIHGSNGLRSVNGCSFRD